MFFSISTAIMTSLLGGVLLMTPKGGSGPSQATPAVYSVRTNGTSSFLSVSDTTLYQMSTTQLWTLSIWMKPETLSTHYAFFTKRSAGSVGWGWGQAIPSVGRMYIQLRQSDAATNVTSTTAAALTAGQWVHLMVCHQPGVNPTYLSVVTMMVNRVLVATSTNPNTLSTSSSLADTTAPMRIARDAENSKYTPARWADPSIFVGANLCTTQAWADAMAVNGKPANLNQHPKFANLIAWWRPGNAPGDAYPNFKSMIGGPDLIMTSGSGADVQADYP